MATKVQIESSTEVEVTVIVPGASEEEMATIVRMTVAPGEEVTVKDVLEERNKACGRPVKATEESGLAVDGRPATLDTPVTDGSSVVASERHISNG